MSKVFLDPHGDDSVLFAAYQIMLHRPLVVVVYDSYVQVSRGAAYCDWETRREETEEALVELDPEYGTAGHAPVFLGLRDDTEYTYNQIASAIASYVTPNTELWAPAWEDRGHDQHNVVANAGLVPLVSHVHMYTTYTRTNGRTRTGTTLDGILGSGGAGHVVRVDPTPDMIARKHRALACYTSQITNPSCRPWFTGDLEEYLID